MMKGPMLQALLVDGFHLRSHRETRQVPIYELAVAKSGSKLRAFDGKCPPIDFAKDIPSQLETDGTCVFVGANNTWDAPGQTIDDFIKTALSDLDRPVVNVTGLPGRFDFHLDLTLTMTRLGSDGRHRHARRRTSTAAWIDAQARDGPGGLPGD